jgi:hypothetical protein
MPKAYSHLIHSVLSFLCNIRNLENWLFYSFAPIQNLDSLRTSNTRIPCIYPLGRSKCRKDTSESSSSGVLGGRIISLGKNAYENAGIRATRF